MLNHHLIINGCHLMDFLLFSWHCFLCCSHSRCFGKFGSNPDFDEINMQFIFSSISTLNETLLFLNIFSIFVSSLFFCWFKNRTPFWSCWIFFSKYTQGIYLLGMYLLLLFDFSLSTRWVIVVRCLQKTSQLIARIVSSSCTELNVLFSILALTFFCSS